MILTKCKPLDSGNLIGSISWPSTTDNGNNLICRCLPINIEELHFCITHVHHQDNHFVTRHIHIQLARRPEKNSLIWIRLQRLQSLSCRQKNSRRYFDTKTTVLHLQRWQWKQIVSNYPIKQLKVVLLLSSQLALLSCYHLFLWSLLLAIRRYINLRQSLILSCLNWQWFRMLLISIWQACYHRLHDIKIYSKIIHSVNSINRDHSLSTFTKFSEKNPYPLIRTRTFEKCYGKKC